MSTFLPPCVTITLINTLKDLPEQLFLLSDQAKQGSNPVDDSESMLQTYSLFD
jgi:hypothetical protein